MTKLIGGKEPVQGLIDFSDIAGVICRNFPVPGTSFKMLARPPQSYRER